MNDFEDESTFADDSEADGGRSTRPIDGRLPTRARATPALALDEPDPSVRVNRDTMRVRPERYGQGTLLGTGGMGNVVLCQDRVMNRDVALKVMRPEHAERPDLKMRFLREARIQAKLEHPGIVPIYDLGETHEGTPFFAMKRLQGRTLYEVLASRRAGDPAALSRYPLRRLVEILSSACQTVLFAHHRDVVHRDLKPANIMIGEFGEVYVLDWGIAKLGEQATSSEQYTQVGERMGTPGYLAPEQAIGSLEVDERADVYAMGAILFEVLAQEPLFAGTDDAIVQDTLQDVPRSPAARRPDLDIPPELDAICAKALRYDPSHRYASIRDLHDAIEGWLAGERDALERGKLVDAQLRRAARLRREDPAKALQAITSALTIDPGHQPAMRDLVDLLAAPGAAPEEATRALEQRRAADTVSAAGRTFFAYAFFAPCLVLIHVAGIRSRTAWTALLLCVMFTAFAGLAFRRWPTIVPFVSATVFGFATLGLTTLYAGPFGLAPCLVVGNGAALMIATRARPRMRWGIGTLSLAALGLPFLASYYGLMPMPYEAVSQGILVRPVLANLSPDLTFATLTVAALVSVGATYHLVGRAVDRLEEVERRSFMRAWQLGRVLPGNVSEVVNLGPTR